MSTLTPDVRPLRPSVGPAEDLQPASTAVVVAVAAALSGFVMGCLMVGAFWFLA